MRVLGAAPASEHVALVVLDIDETGWSVVDTTGTRKVSLGNHEDPGALRDFKDAVSAFIDSHSIEKVVIRRCTYKGQKRSGAASIKMETLLQLLPCESQLVPAQTIARRFQEHAVSLPSDLAKYQSDAFATALWAKNPPADEL
jgi:hypothetical protein